MLDVWVWTWAECFMFLGAIEGCVSYWHEGDCNDGYHDDWTTGFPGVFGI